MEKRYIESKIFRQNVLEKLRSKKIILLGTGSEAAVFYNKYQDIIGVKVIAANYFMTDALSKFHMDDDVETKKIDELSIENNTEYFYIIAINYDISYMSVEFQLEEKGLVYGENFIDQSVAEAILSEKKILVTAGDCLLDAISIGLNYFEKFREKYYIKHFYNLGRSRFFNKLYYRMAKICDCYVLNRHLVDPYNFYFEKEELSKNCQIIYVATPEFRGFWPQTPKRESAVNPYHIFPHDGHPVGFTMREDMNINKIIESGEKINIESYARQLMDENYYSKEEVVRNYDVSLNVIKHTEKACDIKISDYFIDNLTTKKLAKEYSHYQNDLILEMCRRLIVYLEPEMNEKRWLNPEVVDEILPFTEMPIYLSVAKHLNLNYITDTTKYKIRTYKGRLPLTDPYTFNKVYYGIEELSFIEYVKRYYDYCITAKKLMKVW